MLSFTAGRRRTSSNGTSNEVEFIFPVDFVLYLALHKLPKWSKAHVTSTIKTASSVHKPILTPVIVAQKAQLWKCSYTKCEKVRT